MHTTHAKQVFKFNKIRPKTAITDIAGFIRRHLRLVRALPSAHSRRFVREYSLPLIVTIILLLMVGATLLVRASERSSLADWLLGVSGGGEGYTTLLSRDKTDEFKKNDNNNDPVQSRPGSTTPTTTGNSPGSFTVNPGGTTTPIGGGTTTPPTSPGSPPPPPPPPSFSASIIYFQQDSMALECPLLGGLNPNRCSKRYVFGSGVRTSNGPGSVGYSWKSNISSANQTSSFSAGSGEVNTPLQKEILIGCKDPGNYTLQFVINTPTQTQSGVLTINHNC